MRLQGRSEGRPLCTGRLLRKLNLSVRYVGQPVLALALDRTKLRAMNRDEFRGILVSLGAFYDVEHAPLEDGPAARQQHRKYVAEIELMRATRAMAAATL